MKKIVVLSVTAVLLLPYCLVAQKTVAASAGQASGPGGSSSYTVGQVDYSTASGIGGSTSEGVQHPFEVSIITASNGTQLEASVELYPNPTTRYVRLEVNSLQASYDYQLTTIRGEVIEANKIAQLSTSINLQSYESGTYLLKVTDNKNAFKTFQIIKH